MSIAIVFISKLTKPLRRPAALFLKGVTIQSPVYDVTRSRVGGIFKARGLREITACIRSATARTGCASEVARAASSEQAGARNVHDFLELFS